MQIKTILRLLGLLLMMFSTSMLTPLLINGIFHEQFWRPFVSAFACTFFIGFLSWFLFRKQHRELKTRDGFLIVVFFWFGICFFASLPFIFAMAHHTHNFTDAFFESVAGFTTTGATIVNHIDKLPHAILFYRQQLQFLGGMGIVVLAVAILPMLGVGGMQLYRAETPGPMKDSKLTPRIAQTAKALWSIYLILTVLCMLAYWASGMNWFDALGESFATVSTGGFSMHDASFAYYQSDLIELIACLFMLLGGTNFALHFIAFQKKSIRHYWQDEEFRAYFAFLALSSVLVTVSLVLYGYAKFNTHTVIHGAFNVISMATTTGFVSEPFNVWPTFLPVFIILLGVIGGCAASTSGGIKVIRALLLFKQSKREIPRLLHPNAIIPIKFGKHILPEQVLQSMWAFISVFIALFLLLIIVFMALGNDFITSFSAIISCLANSGTGLGAISTNFAHISHGAKWVLIFAMIAGRLEIFSLLILFSPQFWQK
ncbi:MAG: potassium transporter [Legionellales bacterium RIFCSPHIGHO2_12_FULL_42_9]|nr:MAG: potassium transporter [Legionellales bacterium RIFCSPHIGHO2_12_FULL_42_9]